MPGLGLYYWPHAQRRMRDRLISDGEVRDVLDLGRETQYVSESHPDRIVVLGSTSMGRRLKIVLLANDETQVVTVMDRDEEA